MARHSSVRLAALALLLAACAARAAPTAEPWPRWMAHDEGNATVIDHADWDALLARYRSVPGDGIARFAYGKVSADDRKMLAAYLARLQQTRVHRLRRAEQRAFWINLYNATTVNVVLEHYPVDSIRKIAISPGLFSRGPWGAKLLEVEDEAVSLDDIEHRILRPGWDDPRTHYAVNCASLGCPNLPAHAFTADNLEAQLTAGAHDFVNHRRGARVENGKLVVSSIYAWFKADFGGGDAGVIAHLKRFAEAPLSEQLAQVSRIDRDEYDWSLNDAR